MNPSGFLITLEYSRTADNAARLRRALEGSRVVHMVGTPDDLDLQKFYRGLAGDVGHFVKRDEDYLSGHQDEDSEEWLDIRFDPQRQHESFRFSNTRQPLHTDGAYTSYRFDISFFFCLQNAEEGGATTFFDGPDLLRLMQRHEPQLLAALQPHRVIFDKGSAQRREAKVIALDDSGPRLCWNHFRISQKNSEPVRKLCDDFQNFLERRIVYGGLCVPVTLKRGEAVFFHDERVLHGRNAFFGERCLIKGGINL